MAGTLMIPEGIMRPHRDFLELTTCMGEKCYVSKASIEVLRGISIDGENVTLISCSGCNTIVKESYEEVKALIHAITD